MVVSKSMLPFICSSTDAGTMTVPTAFSQKLCMVMKGISFNSIAELAFSFSSMATFSSRLRLPVRLKVFTSKMP